MTDEEDAFRQVLEGAGISSQAILCFLLDEQIQDGMGAWECTVCEKQLALGTIAYCWGEPIGGGGKYVAVSTHCSEECTETTVTEWWQRTTPPGAELYITYYAINYTETEET